MSKYKLLASDVDGTLTAYGLRVSGRVENAIERLKANGKLFTLATGRNILGLKSFKSLVSGGVPLITYHGAVITDADGNKLFERLLPRDVTRRIIELGWDRSRAVMLWNKGVMYANKTSAELRALESFCGESAVIIKDIAETDGFEASKVIWIDDADCVERHLEYVAERDTSGFSYYTSHPFFLEFVPEGIDKGAALKVLSGMLGIDREEIVAVGDGMNDLSMVEYAGLGVAMGNAPDELKRAADFVAPTAEEDGLAVVIERFML